MTRLTRLNGMRPVHPGEVLLEDVLKPLGMSARALAAALRVPHNRISAIVSGKRAMTADTALRLARALGGDARSWMNLQQAYDLRVAELDKASDWAEVRPVKWRKRAGRMVAP